MMKSRRRRTKCGVADSGAHGKRLVGQEEAELQLHLVGNAMVQFLF
jgi:hypothetical protein